MFRVLAASINNDPAISGPDVFALHPMQLSRFLEETWANRPPAGALPAPQGLEVPGPLVTQEATSGIALPTPPLTWRHLIYAYMIENTRVYEIFRRVLEEFTFGERLGIPSEDTQRWLRTTEQLFYSAESPLQIYTLTSWIRPDLRATRRNLFQRFFGMDLNHGTDDNRPYPYPRASAWNADFVSTFEEFMREVWRGVENYTNTSGARPTDDAAIANLARRLEDMLRVRRADGAVSRDELLHTSTMSWFHLALSFNSPIVQDLEAEANAPEERLIKIARRVGMPAHSRSGAYFRLADDSSFILRGIELGQFSNPANVPTLYTPSPPAPAPPVVLDAMLGVIRDWSIASGRDMKARQVSIGGPQPRPARPAPQPIPSGSGNGNGRVTSETSVPV
jgi:hypothetical protein